jgi:hypothetical protein
MFAWGDGGAQKKVGSSGVFCAVFQPLAHSHDLAFLAEPPASMVNRRQGLSNELSN